MLSPGGNHKGQNLNLCVRIGLSKSRRRFFAGVLKKKKRPQNGTLKKNKKSIPKSDLVFQFALRNGALNFLVANFLLALALLPFWASFMVLFDQVILVISMFRGCHPCLLFVGGGSSRSPASKGVSFSSWKPEAPRKSWNNLHWGNACLGVLLQFQESNHYLHLNVDSRE